MLMRQQRLLFSERLAMISKRPDGCWLWTGYLNHGGYPRVTVNGESQFAHRAAYKLLVGPIPDGLTLDHLCRVKRCVNPAHMEPVTLAENIRRGKALCPRQEKCQRGHPFSDDNVMYDSNGHRHCRECGRATQRRHYEKHREKRKAAALAWYHRKRKAS